QKELGEGEEGAAEAAELKKAIDDAGMPEDVHKHAAKELKRLQRMGKTAPSPRCCAPTWNGSRSCRGATRSSSPSISGKRARCSTRTTATSRRSSAASSSTSR